MDNLLQIPCVITKVSTLSAGGWNITFHVPEMSAEQVRPLIGTENKQNFVMMLVKGDTRKEQTDAKASDNRRKGKPVCQP